MQDDVCFPDPTSHLCTIMMLYSANVKLSSGPLTYVVPAENFDSTGRNLGIQMLSHGWIWWYMPVISSLGRQK